MHKDDNSLTHVIEQIRNEVRVDDQGCGFASILATAKIVGISHTALNKAFDPGNFSKNKLAQMLVAEEFDPGNFSKNGVPDQALEIIAYYYAMDAGKKWKIWGEI